MRTLLLLQLLTLAIGCPSSMPSVRSEDVGDGRFELPVEAARDDVVQCIDQLSFGTSLSDTGCVEFRSDLLETAESYRVDGEAPIVSYEVQVCLEEATERRLVVEVTRFAVVVGHHPGAHSCTERTYRDVAPERALVDRFRARLMPCTMQTSPESPFPEAEGT